MKRKLNMGIATRCYIYVQMPKPFAFMPRLYLLTALLLMVCATSTYGQRRTNKSKYFTIEGMIGVSQYGGELTTPKEGGEASIPNPQAATLATTQLGGAIGLTYQFHPHLSVKGNFMFTRVVGDDYFIEGNPNANRGLHFKSYVAEVSAQLRYHFIPTNRHSKFRPKIDPYIFGGVGFFYYDPYVIFENRDGLDDPGLDDVEQIGEKIKLRDFPTEGEEYSNYSIAIPFGFGVKYAIAERWNIGIEVGLRATFTDNLDNVSGVEGSGDEEFGSYYYNSSGVPADAGATAGTTPSWAAELSNGGFGVAGGAASVPGATERLGNPSTNDWYAFSGITIGYVLQQTGVACPKPPKARRKKFIFF